MGGIAVPSSRCQVQRRRDRLNRRPDPNVPDRPDYNYFPEVCRRAIVSCCRYIPHGVSRGASSRGLGLFCGTIAKGKRRNAG